MEMARKFMFVPPPVVSVLLLSACSSSGSSAAESEPPKSSVSFESLESILAAPGWDNLSGLTGEQKSAIRSWEKETGFSQRAASLLEGTASVARGDNEGFKTVVDFVSWMESTPAPPDSTMESYWKSMLEAGALVRKSYAEGVSGNEAAFAEAKAALPALMQSMQGFTGGISAATL